MEQYTEGDRVRIDIPDVTDPDHEAYHGKHGTITDVVEDDVGEFTGEDRDSKLYRIELETGETQDFRSRDLRPPIE